MKIAVFSDVHGNLKALKEVLEQIKDKNVDKTVFLGDIFQRGNEEIECLKLIQDSGITCIKGNCELYLANGVDIDPDVEFIKHMPLFYEIESEGRKLLFTHFLFSDIQAQYPYLQLSSLKDGTFDEACMSEDVQKYDLVAIGHCHRNFVKENVVSVSATGLEGASWLLIDVSEAGVSFEHIDIGV